MCNGNSTIRLPRQVRSLAPVIGVSASVTFSQATESANDPLLALHPDRAMNANDATTVDLGARYLLLSRLNRETAKKYESLLKERVVMKSYIDGALEHQNVTYITASIQCSDEVKQQMLNISLIIMLL